MQQVVGIIGLQWQLEQAVTTHLVARQHSLPHIMLADIPENHPVLVQPWQTDTPLAIQLSPATRHIAQARPCIGRESPATIVHRHLHTGSSTNHVMHQPICNPMFVKQFLAGPSNNSTKLWLGAGVYSRCTREPGPHLAG